MGMQMKMVEVVPPSKPNKTPLPSSEAPMLSSNSFGGKRNHGLNMKFCKIKNLSPSIIIVRPRIGNFQVNIVKINPRIVRPIMSVIMLTRILAKLLFIQVPLILYMIRRLKQSEKVVMAKMMGSNFIGFGAQELNNNMLLHTFSITAALTLVVDHVVHVVIDAVMEPITIANRY
ncbi:hypothetical protein VNO77_27514 [Canavalia gladiata]|uniref:Uncharacterized protein n=1 Tax=Canavalia gladiata TaxID=3824 RepID=A0AAN9KY00_CANGL